MKERKYNHKINITLRNINFFEFYFHFLNKRCCHFIQMAVKMRRNSSCFTQIYLSPVIEKKKKNALVHITLF